MNATATVLIEKPGGRVTSVFGPTMIKALVSVILAIAVASVSGSAHVDNQPSVLFGQLVLSAQ